MMGQVFGVIGQYLVIFGFLIGLFLVLRKPEGVSKILDSLSNMNVGAINAFKK